MAVPTVEYTTREMLAAQRNRPTKTTLFTNWFVGDRPTHATKYLMLDKVGAYNMTATYTHRHGDAHKVARGDYTSDVLITPYTYEEFPITPEMVDDRLPGQNEFEADPETIAETMMLDAIEELDNRLDVLEERQIAEALQTGLVVVAGKGVSYTVDYGQAAANLVTLAGADLWNVATSDIPGDLTDWADVIEDGGGLTPDLLLLGRDAAKAFKADATVLANLDNRRVDMGMIAPKYYPEQRATWLGEYRDVGVAVQVWEYNGKYDYISGGVRTRARFMNPSKAIMTSSALRLSMHYGKIENFNAPGFRGRRFPTQFIDPKGKHISYSVESSPLIGFDDTASVLCATVL